MGTGVLLWALGTAACDEETTMNNDAGSTGGGAEAGATGGGGSGDGGAEDPDGSSNPDGSSSAGDAGGGGEDDAGGGDDAGSGGPTEAAPNTIVASITTDGNSAEILCDKTEGDDIFALDRVGAGYAGDQANITCPASTAPMNNNPSVLVVLKNYASLPASFTFDESDLGSAWEIRADAGPDNGRELAHFSDGTIEASLQGTWDPATRVLTGGFMITISGNDDSSGSGNGTAEGAFNVTLPE